MVQNANCIGMMRIIERQDDRLDNSGMPFVPASSLHKMERPAGNFICLLFHFGKEWGLRVLLKRTTENSWLFSPQMHEWKKERRRKSSRDSLPEVGNFPKVGLPIQSPKAFLIQKGVKNSLSSNKISPHLEYYIKWRHFPKSVGVESWEHRALKISLQDYSVHYPTAVSDISCTMSITEDDNNNYNINKEPRKENLVWKCGNISPNQCRSLRGFGGPPNVTRSGFMVMTWAHIFLTSFLDLVCLKLKRNKEEKPNGSKVWRDYSS